MRTVSDRDRIAGSIEDRGSLRCLDHRTGRAIRPHCDCVLERTLATSDLGVAAAPPLALLVDAQLAPGALDDATRTAERLTELARMHPATSAAAWAAFAMGRLYLASGQGDARASLHAAISGFARLQLPLEAAQARLMMAHAVAASRQRVAIDEARSALATFEALGAVHEADAAAAFLRTLGVAARNGPKSRLGLTHREAEVLELVGRGLSNPEIGDRLAISVKTVEHHVSRLLSKLGLRNRAEAAAYAAHAAVKLER
jgi:DNA-binding CsgD family transcriptional regulator